jgi:O-antigen ligase
MKNLPSYIYLVLFSCVGFVYSSLVVDVVGIQWYYLSYVNLFFLAYVIYKRISNKSESNPPLFFKNPINLLYSLFFLFCIISLISSLNLSVSIIAISKIVISLTSLFIFNELEVFKNLNLKHISILFSLYLIVEVAYSLRGYFEAEKMIDFQFWLVPEFLKGITGNKNITAASIAFKIPFIYLLFSFIQNKYFKVLLILIISVVYFNLFLLSSRAIIVSISICILFFIVGSLISFYRSKGVFINYLKWVGIYLLPVILAYSFLSISINDENFKIENRLSTITSPIDTDIEGLQVQSDVSTSNRLRYYKSGLNYFFENPILGTGIGNWQILSIKLDSDNIESYIVPFVAHNDYIELLAEIGIFGMILYLFFILSPLYFLLKIFFMTKDQKTQNICLILTLPFIVYFFDSNLNFPQFRPIMQVGLLIYLLSIHSFYHKEVKTIS